MTTIQNDIFPYSPRVLYERAPLVEVLCQIRFPTILRIESETPAAFQEAVRDVFPLFERGASPFPPNLPPEIAKMVGQLASPVTYQFLTEDRTSTLTLSSESIALSTSKYDKWENFRDRLRGPLAALNEIFRPAYYSRIGLRYINVLQRERLGLMQYPWSKLLRREALGEVSEPSFEDNLELVNRVLRMKNPDGTGSILIQHGLSAVQSEAPASYVIDIDFFVEQRTGVQDAEQVLDRFNDRAGRVFRWYIGDLLSDALGPK